MKYRIIATIVLLAILAAVVVLTNPSKPTPSEDQDNGGLRLQ
jgi:hypothetical protein